MRWLMEKSEHVAEQFRSGLNCAQAVLGEYASDLGVDLDTARRIACAFGGGLGHTGGVCGAVNGAIMVIGLAACSPGPGSLASSARADDLVRSFLTEFEQRHGSTVCSQLLGCDIGTPEGRGEAARLGVFDSRCPTYVRDAVEILDELLDDAF